jgi:aminopeptidase N
MIAIPDFSAGAMENWGLITYRETAMLFKEGVSAATNKQRIAIVISHELAHQGQISPIFLKSFFVVAIVVNDSLN